MLGAAEGLSSSRPDHQQRPLVLGVAAWSTGRRVTHGRAYERDRLGAQTQVDVTNTGQVCGFVWSAVAGADRADAAGWLLPTYRPAFRQSIDLASLAGGHVADLSDAAAALVTTAFLPVTFTPAALSRLHCRQPGARYEIDFDFNRWHAGRTACERKPVSYTDLPGRANATLSGS